eukprot:415550_1
MIKHRILQQSHIKNVVNKYLPSAHIQRYIATTAIPIRHGQSNKYNIGQCKQIQIKCISEVGWFNNDTLLSDINESGGMGTSQWDIKWDSDNSAGSCSLVEITHLDPTQPIRRFLLDTGWNDEYMDQCFKREGIDVMLQNDEIDFVFISHEHMDHLWGVQTVLKYNPFIQILLPNTFRKDTMHFLRVTHHGPQVLLNPDELYSLYPGCAAKVFDIETVLDIRGEASLYFDVADKGLVCVTGCCHQGVEALASYASQNIERGSNMYGVYGGLHINPFGDTLSESQIETINRMNQFDFKKIACNHCTGVAAVQKMMDLGYPIVRGAAKYGSKSDLYVGNGDQVQF